MAHALRIFLSYHTPERESALALKTAVEQAVAGADVFVDRTHLRYGQLWQPALFEAISKSDAFLILVSNRLGDWQKVEYYEARDRKAKDDRFVLLPIFIADRTKGAAANLPGLAQLHWIEATEPTAPEPFGQIVAALTGTGIPKAPEPWRTINPYRGLVALEEQDADFFFGRDLETSNVLDAMMAQPGRLIALIGSSGVGKSSLVAAGVMASLKRQRWPGGDRPWPAALADSRAWGFVSMKPGDDPVGALVSAFAALWFVDATDPDRIARRNRWTELLKRGEGRLADLVEATEARLKSELGLTPPRRLLLYVDQGEELYARAGKDDIRRFSELLAEGLADPRLVVMTSQRADYYGQLQANHLLFPLAVRIDVPPLSAEAMKSVLRAPAKVLGVTFESAELVDHIVATTEDQPGALPLLADLLTDLWERMTRRGDGILRLADRKEIVHIGTALSRRADEFLATHPTQVDAVKRLFTLRLAHVPRQGEPVRRRMVRVPGRDTEWQIAQALAGPDWRLLVTGEHEGQATAEVAHEILLKAWSTLKSWLEGEREFLVWRDEIEVRRREHVQADRRRKRDALLMGLPLRQSELWLKARRADVDPPEQQFIEESIRVDRSRRRLRRVAAMLAFVLVSAFAGVAWWQRLQALDAQQTLEQTLLQTKEQRDAALVARCDEAAEITGMLATTRDKDIWLKSAERFWVLYSGPMYIVETYQKKYSRNGRSNIEETMVKFGEKLKEEEKQPDKLPHDALYGSSLSVSQACGELVRGL
jgi:hypothetical protein